MVLEHHHHADAAGGLHDHRIDDERRVRNDRFVAGLEERAHGQLDQLVAAVAEHDLVLGEADLLGHRLAQVETAAVGPHRRQADGQLVEQDVPWLGDLQPGEGKELMGHAGSSVGGVQRGP